MRTEFEEELEYDLGEFAGSREAPPAPTWPAGRRFDPGPPTIIPSGPYRTSPDLPCQRLKLDAADLRTTLGNLNKSVALLDRIKKAKPRDQQLWDETVWKAEKERDSVEAAMKGMIGRLRSKYYQNLDGCAKRDFAQVTEQVRHFQLQGGWQRLPLRINPTTGDFVENLRRLRDILVFLLRQSR
jgi:hypothetical protein